MKAFFFIFTLIIFITCGYIKYNHFSRDHKIKETTSQQMNLQKNCLGQKSVNERLDCQKEKLNKIVDKQLTPDFLLVKNGEKTSLVTQDAGYFFKIARPESLSLGHGCAFSFYFFDFDDKSLYLSKDNSSGVVVCGQGKDLILIVPTQLTDAAIKKSVKELTSLVI